MKNLTYDLHSLHNAITVESDEKLTDAELLRGSSTQNRTTFERSVWDALTDAKTVEDYSRIQSQANGVRLAIMGEDYDMCLAFEKVAKSIRNKVKRDKEVDNKDAEAVTQAEAALWAAHWQSNFDAIKSVKFSKLALTMPSLLAESDKENNLRFLGMLEDAATNGIREAISMDKEETTIFDGVHRCKMAHLAGVVWSDVPKQVEPLKAGDIWAKIQRRELGKGQRIAVYFQLGLWTELMEAQQTQETVANRMGVDRSTVALWQQFLNRCGSLVDAVTAALAATDWQIGRVQTLNKLAVIFQSVLAEYRKIYQDKTGEEFAITSVFGDSFLEDVAALEAGDGQDDKGVKFDIAALTVLDQTVGRAIREANLENQEVLDAWRVKVVEVFGHSKKDNKQHVDWAWTIPAIEQTDEEAKTAQEEQTAEQRIEKAQTVEDVTTRRKFVVSTFAVDGVKGATVQIKTEDAQAHQEALKVLSDVAGLTAINTAVDVEEATVEAPSNAKVVIA